MVWVQGTVESVSADRESASLSDGKGSSIRLLNLSTTPGNISRSYLAPMIFFLFIGGCQWLRGGLYIQVIGQLMEVKLGQAQIKCTKLTDQTSNKHCQKMWDMEVSELHNLLSGKINFRDL